MLYIKNINIRLGQKQFDIKSNYAEKTWLILATWPPDVLPFTNRIELKFIENENMIWYAKDFVKNNLPTKK